MGLAEDGFYGYRDAPLTPPPKPSVVWPWIKRWIFMPVFRVFWTAALLPWLVAVIVLWLPSLLIIGSLMWFIVGKPGAYVRYAYPKYTETWPHYLAFRDILDFYDWTESKLCPSHTE